MRYLSGQGGMYILNTSILFLTLECREDLGFARMALIHNENLANRCPLHFAWVVLPACDSTLGRVYRALNADLEGATWSETLKSMEHELDVVRVSSVEAWEDELGALPGTVKGDERPDECNTIEVRVFQDGTRLRRFQDPKGQAHLVIEANTIAKWQHARRTLIVN
jgi:hypothetical protein